MATHVQTVSYFYTTVKDQPGEAYRMLERLSELGINLLAFTAIPIGPNTTQLTLFPADEEDFTDLAKELAMAIDGPHHALLVQGTDTIGALAGIHKTLFEAGVNVYASTGVSSGKEGYGYILYIRPESFHAATTALHLPEG
jgi:predicted amino acid-binding ACT domain protein